MVTRRCFFARHRETVNSAFSVLSVVEKFLTQSTQRQAPFILCQFNFADLACQYERGFLYLLND